MKAFRLRVAIALLAAFTFAACLPGAAIADEGDLQSALDDYAAGRYDDALTKLKDYLAGNPDSAEVYAVLRSAEDRSLIRAMAQGGDHQRYVQYMLDLARPAADADGLSDDDIKAASEAAVEDPAIDVRRRAAVRLRQAGALAVPYLYPYFAEENVDRVVNAMMALKQIGSRATLPLCEVLHSDNPRVRGFAAATLGEIGDRRATPCLKAVAAGDDDGAVQERATSALGKIGARSGSAADSYVRVGNRYYQRDMSLAEDFSATQNMWRWEDGSLQRYEVPFYLFAYQMAEESAADALALDNAHDGARCLLVRSLLAQAIEAEARGDDAPEALAGATSVAASQGFDAAAGALRASLQARDWDVATRCADLMAATYGGESLASSPLGDALAAPHKHLRYSAAIAALQMSPKKSLPNADKVAALAAQAASESAVRQVLVIDDVDETRSKLMMALAHGGYVSSSEPAGTTGVMRAKAAPTIDVIVIRADLGDQSNTIPNERLTTSLAAIDELTRDARTRDMSIVVLLSDTEEQDQDAIKEFLAAKYGDKIKAFVSTPIVETATLSEISTAAEARDLNEDRKQANALAARAADAFASMDFTCRSFDLSVAIEPLSTAATQGPTPEIRLNAVRALGNLRVGGADALTSALTEGEGDDLKAAAATALGAVLSIHEGTPEQVDALIAATEGDGPVAAAALNAVGQVKSLSDEQRDKLFRMHRRQVASRAQ